MKPYVHKLIWFYSEDHDPAYNIAHVALDDGNLEDSTIRWLIDDYIPHNREEYARDHKVSQKEIDHVIAFLQMLLEIPESDRIYEDEDGQKEFYVSAKLTLEDIARTVSSGGDTTIVIAQFTAEETEGRRIAVQIAEHWLNRHFDDNWESLGNGQYRIKGDNAFVAAHISEYEVQR